MHILPQLLTRCVGNWDHIIYIFILQHLSLFFLFAFCFYLFNSISFFWVFWQPPKNPIWKKSWKNQPRLPGFTHFPTRTPHPTSLVEIFITFSLGSPKTRVDINHGGTGCTNQPSCFSRYLFIIPVQKVHLSASIPGDSSVRLPGSEFINKGRYQELMQLSRKNIKTSQGEEL